MAAEQLITEHEDGSWTIETKLSNEVTLLEIIPAPGHYQERQSPHGPYQTTPGSRELPEADIIKGLEKFHRQDWGQIHPGDIPLNNMNHREGNGSLMGVYRSGETTFWIRQGHHYQPPNVFLPEES